MKWIGLHCLILLTLALLTVYSLNPEAKEFLQKNNITKRQNKDESNFDDKNSLTQKEIDNSIKMNYSYDYLSNKNVESEMNFEPSVPVLMQKEAKLETKEIK